jgi:hypothetical protein
LSEGEDWEASECYPVTFASSEGLSVEEQQDFFNGLVDKYFEGGEARLLETRLSPMPLWPISGVTVYMSAVAVSEGAELKGGGLRPVSAGWLGLGMDSNFFFNALVRGE